MILKKGKGLGKQLKDFAKDIVVDIDPFGLEKLVVEQARTFALVESKRYNCDTNSINICIDKTNTGIINCAIYQEDQLLRKITISEMVQFFTGGVSSDTDTESKIKEGVSSYIQDYAEKWKLDLEDLTFKIFTSEQSAQINCFFRGGKIGERPIKTLIKHITR